MGDRPWSEAKGGAIHPTDKKPSAADSWRVQTRRSEGEARRASVAVSCNDVAVLTRLRGPWLLASLSAASESILPFRPSSWGVPPLQPPSGGLPLHPRRGSRVPVVPIGSLADPRTSVGRALRLWRRRLALESRRGSQRPHEGLQRGVRWGVLADAGGFAPRAPRDLTVSITCRVPD